MTWPLTIESPRPRSVETRQPNFFARSHHTRTRPGEQMTALHYDATTLLSAYMPGKSTASTTRFTTSDSTPPPSNATTVPSNTTTQYITTTTTATATSTISTGNTQSPAATSSAPSTERQAGGAEDTAPRPAPPRRPLSHSANPAVIGGITGTFGRPHHHPVFFPPATAIGPARLTYGCDASSGSGSHGHYHVHHTTEEEAEDTCLRRPHPRPYVREAGVRANLLGPAAAPMKEKSQYYTLIMYKQARTTLLCY